MSLRDLFARRRVPTPQNTAGASVHLPAMPELNVSQGFTVPPDVVARWKAGVAGTVQRYQSDPIREDKPMTDEEMSKDISDAPTETNLSGAHAAPNQDDSQPLVPPVRASAEVCEACHGTGRVLTTNDLLRLSIALLGDDPAGHHEFVAEFYRRLLIEAPDLAALFPADLTDPFSGGAGKIQRDKLLGALVALSQSYDPDAPDSEGMQILDTHLATFGRSHVRFFRPDGSERGATLDEYAAVKRVLFGTLLDAAGEAWRPEFTDAWSEAYDYAAATMMYAQHRSGARAARYVRPSR